MGSGTLTDATDGTTAAADAVNQYRSALVQVLFPRNVSGVVADLAGEIGSSSIEWLKAHIASGYWKLGDIKPHHTYNGAAPIDQGWFPCLGGVINETNYDAIHGAGAWDIYVVSSALDGLYSPDMTGKYLVGAAATAQDGTGALTFTGNASNQTDIAHTHTGPEHGHQWYESNATTESDQTFDTGGNLEVITTGSTKTAGNVAIESEAAQVNPPGADMHTSHAGTGLTGSGGSGTQDIQPESLEVIYYLRII